MTGQSFNRAKEILSEISEVDIVEKNFGSFVVSAISLKKPILGLNEFRDSFIIGGRDILLAEKKRLEEEFASL